VEENDLGLCTVTETWLNDADSVSIAQLSVGGYFFKNFSGQSQNRCGGTGILLADCQRFISGWKGKQVLRIF